MGLDVVYQAMPANCEVMARSLLDPEFASNLVFFTDYCEQLPEEVKAELEDCEDYDDYAEEYAVNLEFSKAAYRTCPLYPGIEHRCLHLGRKWDMLRYLLSHERRREKAPDLDDSWVGRAILGGEILHEDKISITGQAFHYLEPCEVSTICDRLDGISIEMLHKYWHPQKMSKVGVYKIHPDDSESDFDYVAEDFHKLKTFYQLVKQHKEGVITYLY
jgi:Domain of unknown function (DUF1877)